MRGVDETIGQSEQVIAILGKEGDMPKPSDTQCQALRGKSRCKNQIAYDEEGDNWSKYCREHLDKDNEARAEGKPRVERYVASEESSSEEE